MTSEKNRSESDRKKAIKLAITGGIASGKSLVGNYLETQDIPVIDADHVVHTLLKTDAELKQAIVSHFGKTVLHTETGTINRQALGQWVFEKPDDKSLLESWIHPKTRKAITQFYQQYCYHKPVVACLIPLLFESGIEDQYDAVWLIETPVPLQIKRLTETRQLSEEAAMARIKSQMPLEKKQARLMRCNQGMRFENDGSIETLHEKARLTLAKLITDHG
ncbi:MAG: dephospho-CoA kinase [Cyanobacteria bacterium P01_H01_bin.74]